MTDDEDFHRAQNPIPLMDANELQRLEQQWSALSKDTKSSLYKSFENAYNNEAQFDAQVSK